MAESPWRFLYFEDERDKWVDTYRPSLSDIARLRDWRNVVEVHGLASGSILKDDEDFVVRAPDSRIVVSGVAIPYEPLLVVHGITYLEVAP